MLTNKKLKSHFAKSKIYLIILCILGLAFSYSCSCRDDNPYVPPPITPPGNDDLTGGKDNGNWGMEYTPETTLSTNVMIVNSAGDGMKSSITITVKNADVEKVSIKDNNDINLEVDKGNIIIKDGFNKFETTAKDFILIVNYKKKSAAGDKDTLSKTEEEFEIKIIKATKITVEDNVSKLFKPDDKNVQFEEGNHTFNFKMGTWTAATYTLQLEDTGGKRETEWKDLTVGSAKKDIETKWKSYVPGYNQYFDGIDWVDAQGMGSQNLALYFKFKFKPEIEIDNPDQEYVIKFAMEGLGKWLN